MKILKPLLAATLLAAAFAMPLITFAEGTNSATATPTKKPVPYPFKTCIVSGEKLGGEMGPPIVFVYTNNGANQEIKFCCPMCQGKFLKDADKYMKTIKEAEAKAAAAKK